MRAGGTVTNGSVSDRTALVSGGMEAIKATQAAATVVNFGTLLTTYATPSGQVGVVSLNDGGAVINGSSADTTAKIAGTGHNAIYIKGAMPSTVSNFGLIADYGATGRAGVYMRNAGAVTNGSAQDNTAQIYGAGSGVLIDGGTPSKVANFGTISGLSQVGVSIYAGGTVVNGSAGDTAALITGGRGVYLNGLAPSTLANYGTISASSTSAGVSLYGGGLVTNGSTADQAAVIDGGRMGVVMVNGASTLVNYGTITGTTAVNFVHASGRMNGSVYGTGTVIDAGVIASSAGTSGTAIRFGNGQERLVLEFGATVTGKVLGGSGNNTLELGAGTGTVYALGKNFTNFQTITVDAGGVWTLTGTTNLTGVAVNGPGTLIYNGQTITGGSSTYHPPVITPGTTTISGYSNAAVALTPSNVELFVTPYGTLNLGSSNGVAVYGAPSVSGTLVNNGTIEATNGSGVITAAGGVVDNGNASQTNALITASNYAVRFGRLATGTVDNFGTIVSTGTGFQSSGIQLGYGGTVVNGTNTDANALISGYRVGIVGVSGPVTLDNFGTVISRSTAISSYGIYLRTGGNIVNGSNSDTMALIEGYYRAIVGTVLSTTIVNYGRIDSAGKCPSRNILSCWNHL